MKRVRCGGIAVLTAMIASFFTILAPPASAATVSLTNPGFETGTLSGWSGNASVTTNFNGTAASGSYFAVVPSSGCGWNQLNQSFTGTAGDVISGWAAFKAGDYLPYNDAGQVVVYRADGSVAGVPFYRDVAQVGNYGQTPWIKWSYTLPTDGGYRLSAMATNSGDCGVESYLFLDADGPLVRVAGVVNGGQYDPGAVPAATCIIDSHVDGHIERPATLSALTGPYVALGLGSQTASCSYTDSLGLSASASATYNVVDRFAPTLAVPTIVTVEATAPSGATVSYTTSVVDGVDPAPVVTCNRPSGGQFAVGTTTVTCTARDFSNNAVAKSFPVKVVDTTKPVLSLPTSVTFEATGPNGATVGYTASATDIVSGNVPVACNLPSGTVVGLGTLSVSCTATDAAGNTATGGFTATVQDTTKPVLVVPTDFSVEATAATGAEVTYSTSANDLVNGAVPVACSPASGSELALGPHDVACAAADLSGNTAQDGFTVAVVDTTTPVLGLPGGIAAEATGADGAAVAFAATATDIVSGSVDVTCSAASDATFDLGTTTVTCSATDAAGNEATGSFDVIVVDSTPAAISVTPPATTEATGPAGASVAYEAAANDVVDGDLPVTCHPASGTTFAIGDSDVVCSATDAAGNPSSVTFGVTVADTTAPAVTVPANIVVTAAGASGTPVSYSASAVDTVDGAVPVACTTASGVTFAPGTASVTCSAVDSRGNTAAKSFTVTVRYAFDGFFSPIRTGVNSAKAGQAIPVKFSLGGFKGMDIIGEGPVSTGPGGARPTFTPGHSNLTYDAASGTYHYVWKTEKSWGGTTRTLEVRLIDGTVHTATFSFK